MPAAAPPPHHPTQQRQRKLCSRHAKASGSWGTFVLPGAAGRDDYDPVLALDPDDSTLHVAWTAFTTCASGTGTCADTRYRRIRSGAVFDPERDVVAPNNAGEHTPAITVDSFGRPIVGFHRFNAESYADIYITWSEDGLAFATPVNATPGTAQRDDSQLRTIALHPVTGLPHLIFMSTIQTSPLNTEIMHAELVP